MQKLIDKVGDFGDPFERMAYGLYLCLILITRGDYINARLVQEDVERRFRLLDILEPGLSTDQNPVSSLIDGTGPRAVSWVGNIDDDDDLYSAHTEESDRTAEPERRLHLRRHQVRRLAQRIRSRRAHISYLRGDTHAAYDEYRSLQEMFGKRAITREIAHPFISTLGRLATERAEADPAGAYELRKEAYTFATLHWESCHELGFHHDEIGFRIAAAHAIHTCESWASRTSQSFGWTRSTAPSSIMGAANEPISLSYWRRVPRDNQDENSYCLVQECSRVGLHCLIRMFP